MTVGKGCDANREKKPSERLWLARLKIALKILERNRPHGFLTFVPRSSPTRNNIPHGRALLRKRWQAAI